MCCCHKNSVQQRYICNCSLEPAADRVMKNDFPGYLRYKYRALDFWNNERKRKQHLLKPSTWRFSLKHRKILDTDNTRNRNFATSTASVFTQGLLWFHTDASKWMLSPIWSYRQMWQVHHRTDRFLSLASSCSVDRPQNNLFDCRVSKRA